MSDEFVRPIHYVQDKEFFSDSEVGLNHPRTAGFVRLRDNGDIEIMAHEGLGIVLRPAKNSIIMYADNVKIMTKDEDGLRWNELSFNSQATSYNEPTFIQKLSDELHNTYKDVEHFLFDENEDTTPNPQESIFPQVMVTDPVSGEQITWKQYYIKYRRNPPIGGAIFQAD